MFRGPDKPVVVGVFWLGANRLLVPINGGAGAETFCVLGPVLSAIDRRSVVAGGDFLSIGALPMNTKI